MPPLPSDAAKPPSRRLCVYNGGFLTQKRLRRILALSGYQVRLGLPRQGDAVGVWGKSPTAHRGERIAARTNTPLIRVEDAFLRSLFPGRRGEAPLGLFIDDMGGVHFDGRAPSRLEEILKTHPLDDTALLNRARDGIARLQNGHLSKYSAIDPDIPAPEAGYVLIVDQTAGDASITAAGGTRAAFLEMLFDAREAHPRAPILVKTHPETAQGLRPGHLTQDDLPPNSAFISDPISPWTLLEGAIAVYVYSSQLGFEAILSGHRPVVYGQPFYAGWGLSDDRQPIDRRQRNLTRAQLFAGAMILAPTWYDPYRDTLCTFEDALSTLEAETRAWRDDRHGWSASGMRLWKRAHLQQFFGQYRRIRFGRPRGDRPHMAWAKTATGDSTRVEDGFVRSRGLGAALVPPLSLVLDDLGIYYDPSRPSRLETLIASSAPSGPRRQRVGRLIKQLKQAGVSKYNLSGALPDLPAGRKILVVGQVEDDASITLGAGEIRTNRALLLAARAANPHAILLWKPHPDVEAGLRPGAVTDAKDLCDVVLEDVDIAPLYDQIDGLWTMTSLSGFEALLRGVPVTCAGMPFYAGWGLTHDLMPAPERRSARPDLEALVSAVLIDYPRYVDPQTGRPCPVEVVVDRLASTPTIRRGMGNRLLSKLQGMVASFGPFWR